MEKVALSTQPLYHVYTLLTKVAGVSAAQAQGECLSRGFLWVGKKRKALGLNKSPKARPRLVENLLKKKTKNTGTSGLLAAAYVIAKKSVVREDPPHTASSPAGPLPGLI